jgi:hypothetical protein
MVFDQPGCPKTQPIREGEFVQALLKDLGLVPGEERGDREFIEEIEVHATPHRLESRPEARRYTARSRPR